MSDGLVAWRELLGELGELGDLMSAAIERDDVLGAVGISLRMRHVRAALARVDAALGADITAETARALGEVASLIHGARRAEAIADRWLTRPLPSDAVLLGTPLGITVLVDAMLPAVWDVETDLVVIVGELGPTAEVLGELGQRRLIVLDAASAAPGAVRVESLDELAATIRSFVPNAPSQLVVRAAVGADVPRVEAVVATARDTLSDLRIHRNTLSAFSRTWIAQGAANLPALTRCASVAALDGRFAGLPMIIVAPGPSLARNVHQLRALQGKAIITAFSHSLRPVLAAGVTPDLVVTVDPQDVRYHFEGCDVRRSWLVNGVTVHPGLFELPARGFLSFSANCAVDDWIFDGLGEEALVPGGGSVATNAFSLALRWRCDPIVFVGLDLSFPGGEYYVGTSCDGAARARVEDGVMRVVGWSRSFQAMKAAGGPNPAAERVIELPGWAGGTVPSSFMFGLFHRWFVERMRTVQDVAVYNCTEGGAAIEGMRHVPLATLASTLARDVDVGAILDAVAIDPSTRGARLASHVGSFVGALRRSRGLARHGRELIARGQQDQRLTRVERALVRSLRPLGFASLLAQHEIDRAHDRARRATTPEQCLAASAALLATVDSVLGELEPTIERASRALGRSHG